MKILSLGLDNSVLNKDSALAKRTVEYGNLVDKYFVVVPDEIAGKTVLSDKATAFGVGSINKISGFANIYKFSRNLIKREKFNIVTVQDQYYLAFIGLLLAKKFKIGLEIQVHGFEKYSGLRKVIAKFVIPKANAIRTVSQRLKRRLLSEFGVKEDKITVVPIFVERITYNMERVTRNDNKFIFLTVGRLVAVKNIEMQIKAMAEVVKKYQNIELWIIGSGTEEEKLKVLSFRFQVSENVKFFGWQNDLSKYYEQADAFLLTSNSEGWGMAVIEAASYGLPIIMTDVGCAGEVVINGESGIVIPVGDQSKLEESMIKLINNAELRKKLGEGARQAVMSLLNKDETLKLYKKSWEKAKIKL